MKRFDCVCGARLFFDSTHCSNCGRTVGFDVGTEQVRALDPDGSGGWSFADAPNESLPVYCFNGTQHGVCNWLIRPDDNDAFCVSCRLNDTIPSLTAVSNLERWAILERAKRRLIYTLIELGLNWTSAGPVPPLGFSFLEDQRTNPAVTELHVFTGYGKGLITINVAEADGVIREQTRAAMNEAYRTVLGHMRHESGHYFWERLVRDDAAVLTDFRALFGDDSQDYATALARYHEQGPEAGWDESFISPYAQSHPLEDFAECWAHYLHMIDTLETAYANAMATRRRERAGEFDSWVQEWCRLSVGLNELNRSMGLPDAYPFVISRRVIDKLRFINDLVSSRSDPTRFPAIP